MITARFGTEKDKDRICEIYNDFWPETMTPPYVQDRLDRKDSLVMVAEEDGKIIAFGFLVLGKDYNEMTHYIADRNIFWLFPQKRIAAFKSMAMIATKEVYKRGEQKPTRFRIPKGTHLLVRNSIIDWMGFQKVGEDQNKSEIWEVNDKTLNKINVGV